MPARLRRPLGKGRGRAPSPARGCITFTTDFGWRDPYVAVMKGQVLRRAPAVALLDISHDVEAHRPEAAGFWLARIWPYFPQGTVHVAVVDPGVGTARSLVALACRGQVFLAPDNGLLWELANSQPCESRRVSAAALDRIGAAAAGPTFHGRDLLAPLAAEIATGRLAFEQLGEACELRPGELLPPAERRPDGVHGRVATVDRYGNLITNVEVALLPGKGAWEVAIAGRRAPGVATYGDAAPGELVAVANAWGLVEVAVALGSAAERLSVGRGEALSVAPARRA